MLLIVEVALDHLGNIVIVAELRCVLDQRFVLVLLIILGDLLFRGLGSCLVGGDEIILLLVLGLLLVGFGLLVLRGSALLYLLGCNHACHTSCAACSADAFEVKGGPTSRAVHTILGEIIKTRTTAQAEALGPPFGLWQFSLRARVEGRRRHRPAASGIGNCHDRMELSKAISRWFRLTEIQRDRERFPNFELNRPMLLHANPHGALAGRIRVPGDKSISHRSLMLAGLAVGESRIAGLLEGEDVLATAAAMRLLGCEVVRGTDGVWTVRGRGVGGLAEPADVIDMGNSGTGARLLLGLLAGHGMTSFVTGDASLRARPMRRVLDPLAQMGAEFLLREGGRLPVALRGTEELLPISYESPVASAQVKSAVLLAGLHAAGCTTVIEPLASRDHTERMLASMGVRVESETLADGRHRVSVEGHAELAPQHFEVPSDPSSAAFPMAAAALRAESPVRIEGVCINPLRSGFLETLQEMGASIDLAHERVVAGEPVADIIVEGRDLNGIEVPAARAPSMIDEYPILAVLASFARGRTIMRGLGELRVKETDRLGVMAEGLGACGVAATIVGDDLIVEGGGAKRPAVIDARLDHRIAMSFLVLGGLGEAAVTVRGAEAIDTSFPGFVATMNGLGTKIGQGAAEGQAN